MSDGIYSSPPSYKSYLFCNGKVVLQEVDSSERSGKVVLQEVDSSERSGKVALQEVDSSERSGTIL